MENITGCVCPMAGYCERHKVTKNQTEHKLCATKQKYFDMWENRKGAGTMALPPVTQQIKNFAKSALTHVASGLAEVSDEEREKRLAICRACDAYMDGRCGECGCILSIKSKWLTSTCPRGLWGDLSADP